MNYYDCAEQIAVLEERISFLKRELGWMLKRNGPSGYGSASFSDEVHGPHNQKEALTALTEIAEMKAEIEELEGRRDEVKAAYNRMLDCIDKMDSINNKVVYLRDVCHLKLPEIADMIGYSYDYVKRISAKHKKKSQ